MRLGCSKWFLEILLWNIIISLHYFYVSWPGSAKPPRTAPLGSCMCMHSHFSHVELFATQWTVAHQAPLSTGFSGQEDWSRLPRSPPGDLPHPGVESVSLMSPALADRFFPTRATWEAHLGSHWTIFLLKPIQRGQSNVMEDHGFDFPCSDWPCVC